MVNKTFKLSHKKQLKTYISLYVSEYQQIITFNIKKKLHVLTFFSFFSIFEPTILAIDDIYAYLILQSAAVFQA